jgi:hypothetical protein
MAEHGQVEREFGWWSRKNVEAAWSTKGSSQRRRSR